MEMARTTRVKFSEEERRQRILQPKSKYAKKLWSCETCGSNITISHRSRHLKSNKHQNSLK